MHQRFFCPNVLVLLRKISWISLTFWAIALWDNRETESKMQVTPRERSHTRNAGHTWMLSYCANALALTCCKRKPSCLPGPTSNVSGKSVPTRRPYSTCIVCSQRRGFHSWLTSWHLMLSTVWYLCDVTLQWTGTTGSCKSAAAMARVRVDTVECISLEWNAPDTGRWSSLLIPNSCRFFSINSNAYNKTTSSRLYTCSVPDTQVHHVICTLVGCSTTITPHK